MKVAMDAEKNKFEIGVEKWLIDHGYTFTVRRRYLTKNGYTISKDGHTENYGVSFQGTVEAAMEQFERYFNLCVECEKLRKRNV